MLKKQVPGKKSVPLSKKNVKLESHLQKFGYHSFFIDMTKRPFYNTPTGYSSTVLRVCFKRNGQISKNLKKLNR
jgi:hypothetical protein